MVAMGKIIASERIKHGLSRESLAEQLGIATETLARYERGDRIPKVDTLEKLCKIFDVQMNIFTDTKKAPTEAGEGRRKISMEGWIRVPIVSREWTACCGTGISAADITNMDEGFVLVDRSRFYRFDDLRRPYAIYCEGDCLESAGIFDGYLAIINPAEEPQNGAIALVALARSLSLKRFYATPSGDVILRSDYGQTRLTPDQMERDEFAVCGVLADVHQGRPKTVPL